MTATSAAGSPRSAGRCTSTPCPAAGRDPTRRRSPPSPAPSSGSPTTPSCCSTGWSPRRPPRCSCRRRAGCAWSCSCTCRSVTARQTTTPTTSACGSARSSRPPPPSSRPARGPGAGCWSCTRCPPTGCTSPSPAVDAADLATGTAAGGALLCVAAVTFDKGHDVLLDALATISDLSWHCVCVGSLDRDPAFVESLRRRSLDAGWTTACTSRDRGPEPISTAATPPRTWWCWRRAPRRTAWSSPRRWPVACRSSRPRSAG